MNIHSVSNNLDMTTDVRVEWVPGWDGPTSDRELTTYACGAAATLNGGYATHAHRATVLHYLDEAGRPVDAYDDTSDAMGAVVRVALESLSD